MSNNEIFDREIVGLDNTSKKISEIIDIEKHTWVTNKGKTIIKHEGVLYLRKFTGAKFLKPELQTEISNSNTIVFLCPVEFPNGEISYEIGEANNDNTKGWSKTIKPTMAFKRGFDRALLRSDTIGLYEVYSEEESDEFKQADNKTTAFPTPAAIELLEDIEVENDESLLEADFPPHMTLYLPNSDDKYPGSHIIDDILLIHDDLDYLDIIVNKYPHNTDYNFTVRKIKQMKKNNDTNKSNQEDSQNRTSSQPDNMTFNDENPTIDNEPLGIELTAPPQNRTYDMDEIEHGFTEAEAFLTEGMNPTFND